MLAMEDVLCELNEDINEQGLPPGFRFHPTDEELITFYLASKVFNGSFCGVHIAEVDLNRCEPWQLPDVAKMGEREWYFFSLRDRKYPTGLRTNRATGAGYWKATGKDREVYSASTGSLLGMKKTLVFYKGRAPRGEKTRWVMHEYRLDGDLSYRHSCKEEWVICRIFHKIGEKRNNPVFQGQSYYAMEGCNSLSPTRGSLPSLLETAMTTTATVVLESQSRSPIQNPSLLHRHFPESDLKTTNNNPVVSQPNYSFPVNELQPYFSPTTNNHPSPSIPLESLLSHQVCSFKQQQQQQQQQPSTVPKQCKTEANFFPFQPPDANLCWVDRVLNLEPYPNSSNNNNPLFFGMDCGVVMGFSSAAAPPDTTTVPDRDVHFDGFYY